jgi:hypothetical protein
MNSYNGVNDSILALNPNGDNISRGNEIHDAPYETMATIYEETDVEDVESELDKIKAHVADLEKNSQVKQLDPRDISTPLDPMIEQPNEEQPDQNQQEQPPQEDQVMQPMEQGDEQPAQNQQQEPPQETQEQPPQEDQVMQPMEQGDDENQDQSADQSPQEEDPNAVDPNDPNMGMGDPNMGGMDMGMGGMGMEDPNAIPKPTSSEEVGRIIELKKIFSRLISVEAYLTSTFEPELLKVRELVAQATELFTILMANYSLYKDEIDERIISYYKFIEKVYEVLHKYYSERDEE